ncbi:MAG: hypothetical protein NDI90_16130 [Nitrospira sp. BO4]|jgi:hypothetical protein|nr:hypothetical protein [Nitrospira sp. BO4]
MVMHMAACNWADTVDRAGTADTEEMAEKAEMGVWVDSRSWMELADQCSRCDPDWNSNRLGHSAPSPSFPPDYYIRIINVSYLDVAQQALT